MGACAPQNSCPRHPPRLRAAHPTAGRRLRPRLRPRLRGLPAPLAGQTGPLKGLPPRRRPLAGRRLRRPSPVAPAGQLRSLSASLQQAVTTLRLAGARRRQTLHADLRAAARRRQGRPRSANGRLRQLVGREGQQGCSRVGLGIRSRAAGTAVSPALQKAEGAPPLLLPVLWQ